MRNGLNWIVAPLRPVHGPDVEPLVLQRGVNEIFFSLPRFCPAGTYEVGIFNDNVTYILDQHGDPGEPLARATGMIEENGRPALDVTLDLRWFHGDYLVGILMPGADQHIRGIPRWGWATWVRVQVVNER